MLRRVAPLLLMFLALAGIALYLLLENPGEAEQPAPAVIAGPPPVAFDPPSFDFGEIPLNTTRAGSVVMRNTGSAPLRVQTARPSCPCVKIDLAPVIIQPGTGVTVPLQIDSLSRPGLGTFSVNVMFSGYEDPAVFTVQRTAVEE